MKLNIIPATLEEVELRRKELSAERSAFITGLTERIREFNDLRKRGGSEEMVKKVVVEILLYREEIVHRQDGIILLDDVRIRLKREEELQLIAA